MSHDMRQPPPEGQTPPSGPGGPVMSHDMRPQAATGSEPAFLATHTLKEGETLSHVALKYYGNPSKPFWSLIYEANKGVIGASERFVKPGMVLKIPSLPPDLKAQAKPKK
jgi:nucleoid-associated protein YgaU